MHSRLKIICLLVVLLATSCSSAPDAPTEVGPGDKNGVPVNVWITTPSRSYQLSKAEPTNFFKGTSEGTIITIDSTIHYQSMDGFGYCLTGGSAQLIHTKLIPSARAALLQELFNPAEGIGISYLRISIGASDLDDHVFSYDDMPAGETDPTLEHFSLAPDQQHLIPVLKEILAINPSIKILGSPWSAPAWMKTNQAVKGGSLKTEYYDAYANYFVKYLQAMQAEGITLDAVTIQNEPENPYNTPSLVMTATEQNEFIKNHLGPAFSTAGLITKIILFDHNCDHPDYPISILNDPTTRAMVDGSAFHLYIGDITALTTVHNAHPEKNVYFTEQWTSGDGDFAGDLRWHIKNLIVGAPRNWSRNVLEWNLASNENFEPHTNDGGCTRCQGALTINSLTGSVARNVSYYIIGHASKFVPPGSIRISSTITGNLYNVAFLTPEGKKVLVVINDNDSEKNFRLRFKGMEAQATLPAGSAGTYVW